jgi:hypothetical protein
MAPEKAPLSIFLKAESQVETERESNPHVGVTAIDKAE